MTQRKVITKEMISQVYSKLARDRWAKIPFKARQKMAPRNGGAPRKYPPCPRYHSHMFSKTKGRCPCGYVRPEKPLSERTLAQYKRKAAVEGVASEPVR